MELSLRLAKECQVGAIFVKKEKNTVFLVALENKVNRPMSRASLHSEVSLFKIKTIIKQFAC